MRFYSTFFGKIQAFRPAATVNKKYEIDKFYILLYNVFCLTAYLNQRGGK